MNTHKYELVVIGGSAGAIEAISKLISKLPDNYPIPIVIIMHRMRNVSSKIEQIFGKWSKTKLIKEADDKELLKPGCVYIAPSNYHLLFEEDKTIALDDSELINFSRPSIDVSFESAALTYKNKLIAILVSGANDDGTLGMKKIKELGGLCIVQKPDEAEYKTMPESAIKNAGVDKVLTINEIQELLLNL